MHPQGQPLGYVPAMVFPRNEAGGIVVCRTTGTSRPKNGSAPKILLSSESSFGPEQLPEIKKFRLAWTSKFSAVHRGAETICCVRSDNAGWLAATLAGIVHGPPAKGLVCRQRGGESTEPAVHGAPQALNSFALFLLAACIRLG